MPHSQEVKEPNLPPERWYTAVMVFEFFRAPTAVHRPDHDRAVSAYAAGCRAYIEDVVGAHRIFCRDVDRAWEIVYEQKLASLTPPEMQYVRAAVAEAGGFPGSFGPEEFDAYFDELDDEGFDDELDEGDSA